MLKLNGEEVKFGHFPDGTIHLEVNDPGYADITWLYESDAEMAQLYFLVTHLHTFEIDRMVLLLPYVPNARQDRVHYENECFTLKYFCQFINSLNFTEVHIFDPHSYVCQALLDRVHVIQQKDDIQSILRFLPKNTTLFYPDDGAHKKYSDMLQLPAAFGIKHRNWEDGKITSYQVAGEAKHMIAGHPVLIIDDICSRGGTFYHAAKALKELGATDIFLYVSHCENSILLPNFNGQSLVDIPNLITEVYTSNDIFTGNHPKIKIIRDYGREF